MDPAERFWSKVRKTKTCWLWEGSIVKPKGYGVFYLEGQNRLAHRLAYIWKHGAIPDGLQIDHLCRVTNCVNPKHLEAVTPRTNLLRGETLAAANAAKTHCPKGHPYSSENTRYAPRGSRMCRACGLQWSSRWWYETRAKHPPNHCQKGHPMTPENVYIRKSTGDRRCRRCTIATNREYQKRVRTRRTAAARPKKSAPR